MPNLAIYFSDENYARLKAMDNRSKLVDRLVYEHFEDPETKKIRETIKGEYDIEVVHGSMGGVPPKKEVKVEKVVDPNICTECNHVKVAGKCINKDCKRKGKL